jgi:LuxR family maltose regulon positive regulatory protein
MFYLLRIAVFQGDWETVQQTLNEMENYRSYNEYITFAVNCEISISWLYIILSQPERVSAWLKEKFAPYVHANTLENFGNQIKARYFYLTGSYEPLLAFMDEKKRRESILFERVEMLAMEACVRCRTGDKKNAVRVLGEAYETAAPNEIVMPFVELGRDMRALISAAESAPECKIPREWQKNVRQLASVYAKNQELLAAQYKKKNEIYKKISLSPRESEILRSLYKGFSNSEIAAGLDLSINTVKMHIGSIYNKLGARNKADIFRIAAEYNLL